MLDGNATEILTARMEAMKCLVVSPTIRPSSINPSVDHCGINSFSHSIFTEFFHSFIRPFIYSFA